MKMNVDHTPNEKSEKSEPKKRKTISPISDLSDNLVLSESSEESSHGMNEALTSTSLNFPDLPVFSMLDEKSRALMNTTMTSWLKKLHENIEAQVSQTVQAMKAELELDLRSNFNEKDMLACLNNQSYDISDLQQENLTLDQRCRVLEGRLARAEKELEEVKEELLSQSARSMRDNLKFFNIAETDNENCEITIQNFLKTEMNISDDDMQRIHFDRVHRVGNKVGNANRVIVGKLNPEGKQIIFRHIKNLDKKKNYGISDQLPREYEERRKQLLPHFKQAKQEKKNVKWSVDKLVIDGRVQCVKKDKITDIQADASNRAVTLQYQVRHSEPSAEQGNSFQAHKINVTNRDDVIPALHAIYADERVARATHNVYAYRIGSGPNMIEHYEDDGEWGAGAKLLTLLRQQKVENKLIVVTRWSGGKHLGKKRFDMLIKVARETINAGSDAD
jgi:hypothetical protein